MANNEYVNRVDFGGETLIDISDTTAEPEDVIEGQTFYTRNGAPATGTLGDATTTTHGLMSATDKVKLDEMDSKKAPIIIDSKSGNPIVINDGVFGLKLYDMKVSFTPKQEGSGDPSPTNIRPITGWNGINIHRSGKNLVQFNSQQGPRATFYNGYSGWLTNGSWRIPDMSIKYTYSAYINNRNASESSCAKIWFYGADGTTSAGITEGTQIAAGAEGWSVVSFGNNVNLYFAAFGLGLQTGGVATQGMVEIGESRTAYEPYSGATIPVIFPIMGKNLFDGEYVNGYLNNNNFITSGTIAKSAIVPCEPNTTYTIKKYESSNRFQIATSSVYPGNDGTCSGYVYPGDSQMEYTYTTGTDSHYLIIYVSTSSEQATPQMMVNIGSTAEPYEPYTNTVYGGVLDALTGVLTVTHKRVKVSDFTWTYNTNGVMRMASNTPSDMLRDGLVISDNYKTVPKVGNWSSFQTVDDYSITQYAPSDNLCIVIKDSRYTVPATFVSEQGNVEIVYELAEPYVVQLNPVQIALLAGTNTVWTDADTAEIAYPIDTKKYIDTGARDVQINGISILDNGVVNIPIMTSSVNGVARVGNGLGMSSSGQLRINGAADSYLKAGTDLYNPVVSGRQHTSVFYGLAKLAGVDLANETVTVGQYPDSAQSAIKAMFGITEIPAATSVDEGKVLRVVNGEWSAVSLPSVSEVSW